ncbi:unnamed protein product, partial [Brassica oleracea]
KQWAVSNQVPRAYLPYYYFDEILTRGFVGTRVTAKSWRRRPTRWVVSWYRQSHHEASRSCPPRRRRGVR